MEKQYKHGYLLTAILVATVCLRAPITALGPVAASIRETAALPSVLLGLMTTIPLVMFAVTSPFISRFSRRVGAGNAMLIGLMVMAAGLLMRSFAGGFGLFFGTVLLGAGISVGNVLIPGVLKAEFPGKLGMVTGAFTVCMSCFAAISAAISYPLSQQPGLDWRHSLAVWTIPTVVAMAFWVCLRKGDYCVKTPVTPVGVPRRSVFRSSTAWWLTVMMGAQALMFYLLTAWLPTILQERGMSPENAGYVAFGYQLMTMPASFLIPGVAAKRRDQRGLTAILSVVYGLSLLAFTFARSTAAMTLSALACGFSTGACFSLCMLLIGLRASDAERAVELSGMVQSLGYGVAAVGPAFAGLLFDQVGSWTIPLLSMLALAFLIFLSGRKAGEDTFV